MGDTLQFARELRRQVDSAQERAPHLTTATVDSYADGQATLSFPERANDMPNVGTVFGGQSFSHGDQVLVLNGGPGGGSQALPGALLHSPWRGDNF